MLIPILLWIRFARPQLIPSLDTGFMDQCDFKSFYKFVFQFSREGTHKTIEKDMVVALLQMVLCDRNNSHLNSFCEYLNSTGEENGRISLDAWQSFLSFSLETSEGCEEVRAGGAKRRLLISNLFRLASLVHCLTYFPLASLIAVRHGRRGLACYHRRVRYLEEGIGEEVSQGCGAEYLPLPPHPHPHPSTRFNKTKC